MVKSKTLESMHIRFGKRTYFFDVKEGENDTKFLKITESKFIEEGKDHQYNSFILYPDNFIDFQKTLQKAVLSMSLSK
jgi:hypothetical protein